MSDDAFMMFSGDTTITFHSSFVSACSSNKPPTIFDYSPPDDYATSLGVYFYSYLPQTMYSSPQHFTAPSPPDTKENQWQTITNHPP